MFAHRGLDARVVFQSLQELERFPGIGQIGKRSQSLECVLCFFLFALPIAGFVGGDFGRGTSAGSVDAAGGG